MRHLIKSAGRARRKSYDDPTDEDEQRMLDQVEREMRQAIARRDAEALDRLHEELYYSDPLSDRADDLLQQISDEADRIRSSKRYGAHFLYR